MEIVYFSLIGGLSVICLLLIAYLAIRTYRHRKVDKLAEIKRRTGCEDSNGGYIRSSQYSLNLGQSPFSTLTPPYKLDQITPISKDEPRGQKVQQPVAALTMQRQVYGEYRKSYQYSPAEQEKLKTFSGYIQRSGVPRALKLQQRDRMGARTWQSTPSLLNQEEEDMNAASAGRISSEYYPGYDDESRDVATGMGVVSVSQGNISSIESSSATELSSSGAAGVGVSSGYLQVSMQYDAVGMCLTIHVHGVYGISDLWQRKLVSQGTSFVKITLYSGDKKVSKQMESPMEHRAAASSYRYDQFFKFHTYRLSDLQRYALRFQFCVYQSTTLAGKKVLGEGFFQLSEVTDWTIPYIEYKIPLGNKHKRRRPSLTDLKQKFMSGSSSKQGALGSLLVLLQYHPLANRLKVFIRKGDKLAKVGHKVLPGSGDHYVTIRLMRDLEIVEKKETKSQSGDCPSWNESFLFPIPYESIDEYWLELVVMLRGVHRMNVLGHVLIGPDTTPTGSDHWKAMLKPSAVESAKWHHIIPTSSY